MDYIIDDRNLTAEEFLSLANSIWPGEYDISKTMNAIKKTMNITARQNGCLRGCIRILTDGCFFGTITELFVHPELQRHGIGSRLLHLAAENTPTLLYFGAQPGLEGFYEKNGCKRSLQSFTINKSE